MIRSYAFPIALGALLALAGCSWWCGLAGPKPGRGRVHQIASDLRCPDCPGLSVADSSTARRGDPAPDRRTARAGTLSGRGASRASWTDTGTGSCSARRRPSRGSCRWSSWRRRPRASPSGSERSPTDARAHFAADRDQWSGRERGTRRRRSMPDLAQLALLLAVAAVAAILVAGPLLAARTRVEPRREWGRHPRWRCGTASRSSRCATSRLIGAPARSTSRATWRRGQPRRSGRRRRWRT